MRAEKSAAPTYGTQHKQMALKQNSFKSIGTLLDVLKRVSKDKPVVWFRGQAVARWNLRPSIMRPPHSFDDELVLLKRFKQNAVPLVDAVPAGEADWLFLMQHHKVPTRLLDWTESPLVALYFAVGPSSEGRHDSKDAALWCLFPHSLNALAGIHLNSRSKLYTTVF